MTNYLGSQPIIGNFVKLDAITVVNGQAAYTMQNGGVNFVDYSSVNQFMVSLNSVIQSPGSSFSLNSSTITFASNLVTGDVIDFIIVFGNSLSSGVPTDATVSTAKIVDDAVTAAKINDDIISGSTELASEPADTDEFLVSDAGTLKRIDYSLIKGGGITEVDMWRVNTTTSISGGSMDITANWERCDTNFEKIGTGLTESSGVFTFPSTGKYLTCYDITFKTTATTAYAGIYLYLSTDGGSNFSHIVANTNTQIYSAGALSLGNASGCGVIDVTDASQFKWKLNIDYQNPSSGSPAIYAHTDRNRSYIHIIRLGDT